MTVRIGTAGNNDIVPNADGYFYIDQPPTIRDLAIDDNISGLAGNDTLGGGVGNDTIDGGDGDDYIRGGEGNDYLIAGAGSDVLMGDGGSDTLVGGLGNTLFMDGGSGDDRYIVTYTAAGGSLWVLGGSGFDTLIIDASASNVGLSQVNLTIDTGTERVDIIGSALADTLIGGDVASDLRGGLGNDEIRSRGGADTIDGGSGIDRWVGDLTALTQNVTFSLNTTSMAVAGGTTLTSIEQVTLTTGSGNDTLTGDARDDTLNAGAGNDVLVYTGGRDYLNGDAGNDHFVVHINALNAGAGDRLEINGGADTDVAEIDATNAASGIGIERGLGDPTAFNIYFPGGFHRLTQVERFIVHGSSYDDQILGTSQADLIEGGGGNDFLAGGGGGDTIDGGDGADVWIAHIESATANISFSIVGALEFVGSALAPNGDTISRVEAMEIWTGSGNDTLIGGALGDLIDGGAGNDDITGGGGHDALYGQGGNDVIRFALVNVDDMVSAFGGDGEDTFVLDASQAVARLIGGDGSFNGPAFATFFEHFEVTGSAFDDFIFGGESSDTLRGGLGDDTLIGWGGTDFIDGGSGSNDVLHLSGDRNDYDISYLFNTDTFTVIDLRVDARDGNQQVTNVEIFEFHNGITRIETSTFFYPIITVSAIPSITEGGTTTFTLTRTSTPGTIGAEQALSIPVTVSVNGQDHISPAPGAVTSVTFAANAATATVSFTVGEDTVPEGLGSITLTLGQPGANDRFVIGATGSATTEIGDNDVAPPPPLIDPSWISTVNFVSGLSSPGATRIVFNDLDSTKTVLRGSFAYDVNGNPSGTITGMDRLDGSGTLLASVTEVNTPLPWLIGAISSVDAIGTAITAADPTWHAAMATASTDNASWAPGGNSVLVPGTSGATRFIGTGFAANTLDGTVTSIERVDVAGNALVPSVSFTLASPAPLSMALAGFDPDFTSAAVFRDVLLTGANSIQGFGELTAGSGNDTLIGDSGNNRLDGDGGNDSLNGGAGADTLNGGTGIDSLAGGADNDTYYTDTYLDSVVELPGGGTDTIISTSSFLMSLAPNVENLTLVMGAGLIDGLGNAENNIIIGNDSRNGITGGGGNDTIIGNGGDDAIDGGIGADSMIGGSGVDTYYVDNAGDAVVETEVGATLYDTVWTNLANYTLPDNVEIYISINNSGSINGTGNDLTTLMLGNEGDNILNSLGGNDIILGRDGNDTINSGAGGDPSGYEVISGGVGADSLTGGGGHDFFNYELITHGGDIITDFQTNAGIEDDILDFRPMFPTFTNTAGITTSAQAVASGHLTYVQSGANVQVFADANGGAHAPGEQVLMATLLNQTAASVQTYTLI